MIQNYRMALFLSQFHKKDLPQRKKVLPLHSQTRREFSSAGLEHLPYKQRVGGSNPSTPTKQTKQRDVERSTSLYFYTLCHKLVCRHKRMKTKNPPIKRGIRCIEQLCYSFGVKPCACSAISCPSGVTRYAPASGFVICPIISMQPSLTTSSRRSSGSVKSNS